MISKKAEYSGTLRIGDIQLKCFVTDEGGRYISGRSLTTAIGMKGRGQGMTRISSSKTLKPFIYKALALAIQEPVEITGKTPVPVHGYPAETLADICGALLDARKADALKTDQERRYGEFAEILVRGFARVGIVALVDEATGYERIREERALATILEKFIDKELQPWTKTFPYEFYEEIYRLKGWPGPDGHKRTPLIGRYTNDLVYDRLAPGVLQALKKRNPTLPSGRRRTTHHQWFTPDLGHPKLKEHLAAVMALMRASPNWDRFMANLNRAFKSKNKKKQNGKKSNG